MIEGRFYRDERGIPRAELPEGYRVVRRFLEDDMQGSLAETRRLRRLIAEFRAVPSQERWEGTGNAWTLILTPEGARLEFELSEDAEPSLDLSLEEFDELLAGWERMLAATRD